MGAEDIKDIIDAKEEDIRLMDLIERQLDKFKEQLKEDIKEMVKAIEEKMIERVNEEIQKKIDSMPSIRPHGTPITKPYSKPWTDISPKEIWTTTWDKTKPVYFKTINKTVDSQMSILKSNITSTLQKAGLNDKKGRKRLQARA